MRYDDDFVQYFEGRLQQVFLYVTDRCGLRCEQCLYKTTLANREMDHQIALAFLHDFRELGAEKLTFIGGEPTLYGRRAGNAPLLELIERAFAWGYQYVRLDTNGQRLDHLLRAPDFQRLSNLSFSIDGHTAAVNDALRGRGTFERCIASLKLAVRLGYYTSITTCVHPGNVDHLDSMIDLAVSLGVAELNFHPLFKMGIARDTFSGETDISPEQWVAAFSALRAGVDAGRYPIHVRAPQRFVATEQYLHDPERYEYCPTRMGERILVHPDGTLRICALCIGTPLKIATYDQERVQFCGWQSEVSNERRQRRPCMGQVRDFNGLTPLCISYKPFQNEYVWLHEKVDQRLFSHGGVLQLAPR